MPSRIREWMWPCIGAVISTFFATAVSTMLIRRSEVWVELFIPGYKSVLSALNCAEFSWPRLLWPGATLAAALILHACGRRKWPVVPIAFVMLLLALLTMSVNDIWLPLGIKAIAALL